MKYQAAVIQILVIAVLVTAWQVAAQIGWLLDPDYVSTPLAIAKAFFDLAADSSVLKDFLQTAVEVGVAFLIGTTLGIIAGTVLGLSRLMRDVFLAPVLFVLSVPKSIFLPLFILYFGIGAQSAEAYGAFTSFFFVTSNVLGGIELVDRAYERLAYAYRASFWAKCVDVVFPAATPGIFAGLWQGIHHSLGGVLTMELFASSAGVGRLISGFTSSFQPADALAVVFAITVLAIVVASGWSALEWRLMRWKLTP